MVVETGSGAPDRLYEAPFRLRREREPRGGLAAARNRGIRAAEGAYCLFLREDDVADEHLVEQHLEAQRERDGALVLGPVRMSRTRGGFARCVATWWRDRYRNFEKAIIDPDIWACRGSSLSAPTAVLRSAGGFDETLSAGQDVELAHRLQRGGLRIVYVPDAGVERRATFGFRAAVRALDAAGTAMAALYRRHPEVVHSPPLGEFAQGWAVSFLARRLLLAFHAPVRPLALIDPLLARRPPARLYRIAALHCLWRSFRRTLDDEETWKRLTRGTVILMYHAIGERGERPSRFVTPLSRFRRQLAWLRRRRYPVLALDDYARYRRQNRLPPAGSVVITFDDGYTDTAHLAASALRRHGMPSTVFIVAGAVGDVNRWDVGGELFGRRLLSWEEVRELVGAGMAVGAHSVSHPRLTDLDAEAVEREAAESRFRLEDATGSSVAHFAYPYGRTSPKVSDVVRRAGFESACGIRPGPNTPGVPIHELRRMEVWGTDSLFRFAIDVWLGRPLRPRKREARAG